MIPDPSKQFKSIFLPNLLKHLHSLYHKGTVMLKTILMIFLEHNFAHKSLRTMRSNRNNILNPIIDHLWIKSINSLIKPFLFIFIKIHARSYTNTIVFILVTCIVLHFMRVTKPLVYLREIVEIIRFLFIYFIEICLVSWHVD